jgi:hypothetical protein
MELKDTRLRLAAMLLSLIAITLFAYIGHCWLYGDLDLPLRLTFMGLTLAFWAPTTILLCMVEMDPVE